MRQPLTCDVCGDTYLDHAVMCDITMKSYCEGCWLESPCVRDGHEEGCSTLVIEGGE